MAKGRYIPTSVQLTDAQLEEEQKSEQNEAGGFKMNFSDKFQFDNMSNIGFTPVIPQSNLMGSLQEKYPTDLLPPTTGYTPPHPIEGTDPLGPPHGQDSFGLVNPPDIGGISAPPYDPVNQIDPSTGFPPRVYTPSTDQSGLSGGSFQQQPYVSPPRVYTPPPQPEENEYSKPIGKRRRSSLSRKRPKRYNTRPFKPTKRMT